MVCFLELKKNREREREREREITHRSMDIASSTGEPFQDLTLLIFFGVSDLIFNNFTNYKNK